MTSPRISRDARSPIWFLAPWLLGVSLLFVLPTIVAILVSITSWDGLTPGSFNWIGFENYRKLPDDRLFWKALTNSIYYTCMNVPAQVLAGLGLALLVSRARRGVGVWCVVYYLPHVFGGVAMILIWWWLLNPQIGPINRGIRAIYQFAEMIGVESARTWRAPPWFYSPGWAKPSLVLMNLWEAGGMMLIFLAALLRDHQAVKDAAMLDGAGRARIFWSITFPHITPAIVLNTVAGIVFSMQSFGQAYLLQNWQQQDSLLFLCLYIYRCAFEFHRFSYAAALSLVLFVILLVFTVAFVRLVSRFVQYDRDSAGAS